MMDHPTAKACSFAAGELTGVRIVQQGIYEGIYGRSSAYKFISSKNVY